MSGIIRKAYRDITRRRGRSLLTLLGIVIGVGGIVAIVSTSRNITRAQQAAYRNATQADVTLWAWNVPPSLRRALEALPNVAEAELRTTFYTKWRADNLWRDIYLVGISDFGQVRINKLSLREGRYPALDEVLLESSTRELVPVSLGQEVLVRDNWGQERMLTISGFAQSPAFLSSAITNIAVAYVPEARVQRMLGIGGSNQVLLKLGDFAVRDETVEEVKRLLDKRRITYGTPQVRDPVDFVGRRELNSLIRLMLLFSGLGLAISGFLVANTLSATVAEQVSEIGVMKAIGATRAQVMRIYLLSAGLYGLVGTVLGIGLGTLGGWQLLAAIARLGNVSVAFHIAPEGILLGIVVGIGVTLVAALPAVWSGTAIPVKAALGSFGIVSTYGQGRLDQLLMRVGKLRPLPAMALRNLSRRRARNLVTLLVIALATAGYLAAQSTRSSVSQAIDQIFVTYKADAWIWFNEPVGDNFAGMIRTVPGVQEAEAWTLRDGWVRHRRARVWGVPADTTLYDAVLKAGRWYRPDEQDVVVISTDLAADRDIALGDVVEIELGDGMRHFRVVGIAVDNSIFLGSTVAGKVFMPVDVADRMLGRQGWADFFALGLGDPTPAAVDKVLGELEHRFRRLRPGTEAAYRDIEASQRPARLLTLALYAMVLIVALVGIIGVLNTLTLNVLERRREIGVMRAIGASDVSLVRVFLAEGVSLGLFGWALGLSVGYPLGVLFVRLMQQVLFQIDYVFAPDLIVTSLIFAVALAAVASLGPALGAARLLPAEALRYE